MAKFLDSSATTLHVDALLKSARQRLVLLTPQLKFSGRTKELLAAKSALDVRVVYARCELQPAEVDWLRAHPFVRTHHCRSITAKCYLHEELCILTSQDLYDFGQVANEDMGILISRTDDPELYSDAVCEAERVLAASEEVSIRVEKTASQPATAVAARPAENGASASKLSTHRLARKLGQKTHELLEGLERLGAIQVSAGHKQLTPHGLQLGGEFRSSARFGDYFVWPENFELEKLAANGSCVRM
ncbi:MAG TPA: hypothetical protein VG095_03080 [Chthoniobacterales bacterium]|nr:hypothetical protein [Chthoniobacterales bacterium]